MSSLLLGLRGRLGVQPLLWARRPSGSSYSKWQLLAGHGTGNNVLICSSMNLNHAPTSTFLLTDRGAVTSADVTFQTSRIAVTCKCVRAWLL